MTALFSAVALTALSVTPAAAQEERDSLPAMWSDLDEIVITGTRTPRLLKDTPVQTRLITSQAIESSDATDIRDLLQQEMPGVEFSYAMNQQVHLNFNGQGGQGVLFLVDGERMAGETMDDVDFSRLGMADVDHVEIVKGASSALYGSNAGGGVVNIITKQGRGAWRVTGDARIGRHKEQRYNLGVTLRRGSVANLLSASRQSVESYTVKSAPDPATRIVTTIYGNSIWNFSDRLTFRPSERLKLTGRAGYFFRQLTRTEEAPERYRDFSAGLRAECDITDSDRLEASYAFDQYDKSDFYRLTGLDVRSYSNVQNSLRLLYTHTFGEVDALTAGVDFMRDYMMSRRLEGKKRSQLTADAFAQYDRVLSERWEVVAALRYDYFSDGGCSRLTPKVSARYTPVDNLYLRAGYGMGFRAPTLKEKYYQFDMAGIWIVEGNPSLKPESSHNFTLSADYTAGCYNITLSGYFNSIRDRIATGVPYYRPGDKRQLYLDYVNLGSCTVAGGEAAVQAQWPGGFSARVAYAYVDEHVAADKGGTPAANQYLPARRHSITARGEWQRRFSDFYSLTASLSGRALSGVENKEYIDYYDISAGTVTVRYPAYTLWKLSVSQRFGKYIRLTLALDNLLNYKPKYYYLNAPITDGASFSAGISIDFH